MGVKGDANPLNHDKYTDAAAKAASVQSGAITNGVTKAPTHDAVYDVKVIADAAQTAAEVAALIAAYKVTTDHGTAATDQLVNVCYGTGAAPTANTTTIGTIYLKYTV